MTSTVRESSDTRLAEHRTSVLGGRDGDWIEVTGFRPREGEVPRADGSAVGSQRTRVRVTEGVHPQVLAFSHNAGRWQGGAYAAPKSQSKAVGAADRAVANGGPATRARMSQFPGRPKPSTVSTF